MHATRESRQGLARRETMMSSSMAKNLPRLGARFVRAGRKEPKAKNTGERRAFQAPLAPPERPDETRLSRSLVVAAGVLVLGALLVTVWVASPAVSFAATTPSVTTSTSVVSPFYGKNEPRSLRARRPCQS